METLAKTFMLLPDETISLKKIFVQFPCRLITNPMIINSAITAWKTKNPLWNQQVNLREIKILREGQQKIDFDAADSCRR